LRQRRDGDLRNGNISLLSRQLRELVSSENRRGAKPLCRPPAGGSFACISGGSSLGDLRR